MQHIGSVFYKSDYSIRVPLCSIRQLFRDLKCCLDRIRKGYCVKDRHLVSGHHAEDAGRVRPSKKQLSNRIL